MKRIPLILLLLFAACSLQLAAYAQKGVVNMKKVIMVLPQDGFRDEEYFETRKILESNGLEVKVASTSLSAAKGMLGGEAKADILTKDINITDFQAIIFVGGMGAGQYWDDPLAQELCRRAVSMDRIVAAICIAPVTFARAGILKGKRATVSPQEAGELKAQGANYTARPVEKDGNIITASGPDATTEFAEEIAKALKR